MMYLKLRIQLAANLGVFSQQIGDVQQQIVKVDRVGGQQLLLINRIDTCRDRIAMPQRLALHHLRRDQTILGAADRRRDLLRRSVSWS